MTGISSKEEQIEALVRYRAYELTMKRAGRDQSGVPAYGKVFTSQREKYETISSNTISLTTCR